MKIKMKREIGKQGKQRIEMVKPNENRTSTENKIHKKKKSIPETPNNFSHKQNRDGEATGTGSTHKQVRRW